ncbi:MAG: aldehyde dehydrogenase family protein [Solirubrobacteraceae bacterium]
MSSTLTYPNLTGGQWVDSGTEGLLEVTDPSNVKRVVGNVPAMGADDIAALYDAAEQGAHIWRRTNHLERARIMVDAAKLIRERADTIVRDLISEMGKTLGEASFEVLKTADFLEYYASFARFPIGTLLADARPDVSVQVHNEPVGIVLIITPWNDPLLTPARKLAPALIAGNSAILKPASETPIAIYHLAAALHDAGLPAGVLGTATGRSSRIAKALIADRRLAAVTFTGSTSVGMQLNADLGGRNVRLQTEMGGKNASVVLKDADLDLATETISFASFGQTGQRCTATSRVIVERPVTEALIAKLVAAANAIKLGPGLDPETGMGPLVSRGHQAEVLGHMDRARQQGAQIVVGGGTPSDPALADGCYVEPTVITEVTRDMAIWREEVFGPAIAVLEVDGLDEAIAATNDSDYGLSAAVFTRDIAAATHFAAEVDTGQVAVNLPTPGWDVHEPFGGFGDSGSPFKEQGLEALRFYTRVKTVAIRASR